MNAPIGVALQGIAGRMGQALMQELSEQSELRLLAGLEHAAHPWVGKTLAEVLPGFSGNVPVVSDISALPEGVQVLIDFSQPEVCLAGAAALVQRRIALVSGTTGLSPDQHRLLGELGASIPVVWAANMSLGVNVLLATVKQVSRLLGEAYDLEILELHHRHKKDAPSGTALALAAAALEPRGHAVSDAVVLRDAGLIGARGGAAELGMGVLRGGAVAGEHTVFFLGAGERLELTHRASDRRAFAQGALRAAAWVAPQPPGFYAMQDVLGLKA